MGRQINLFMGGDDEAEFMNVIRNCGGALIDQWGTPLTQEQVIRHKHRVYIGFPRSRVKKDIESWLDYSVSDVIEFDRSMIRERRIEAGRLWAEFNVFDEQGRASRKEKWFEDKCDFLKKWITRNCRISKDKGYYIGRATYGLHKEQGYRTCTNSKYDAQFD